MKESTTNSTGAVGFGRSSPNGTTFAEHDIGMLLEPCDQAPLVGGRRSFRETLVDIAAAADDMTS